MQKNLNNRTTPTLFTALALVMLSALVIKAYSLFAYSGWGMVEFLGVTTIGLLAGAVASIVWGFIAARNPKSKSSVWFIIAFTLLFLAGMSWLVTFGNSIRF